MYGIAHEMMQMGDAPDTSGLEAPEPGRFICQKCGQAVRTIYPVIYTGTDRDGAVKSETWECLECVKQIPTKEKYKMFTATVTVDLNIFAEYRADARSALEEFADWLVGDHSFSSRYEAHIDINGAETGNLIERK